MKTREELRRLRRLSVLAGLCLLLYVAVLLSLTVYAAEGTPEPVDKLSTFLSLLGAVTAARGITWAAVQLDKPRKSGGK